MTLKSTLESSKSRLDALLTYANNTTSAGDTNIGDAIQTLCSGYGAENHTIEDAFIENSGNADIVYYNDRITELHENAFDHNKRFRVINLPNLTKVSNASQCIAHTSAEEIYLPRASGQSWNSAVCGNANLKILDIGKIALTNIFRDNTALSTIIIRATSVQSSVTSLGTCALLTTGGDVYVPQSLKASYESNSNWSQYSNITFHAIEGSIYELKEE